MKKIYQTPTTLSFRISCKPICDVSNPVVGVDTTTSVNAGSLDSREHRGFGGGLWEDMD